MRYKDPDTMPYTGQIWWAIPALQLPKGPT